MDVSLTRSHEDDPGTWFRAPSRSFLLIAEISFSAEERWVIEAYNLLHHVILDRTPPWYLPALREAERAQARADESGEPHEWPWHVPPRIPVEWVLTVEGALSDPIYAVTFDTAQALADFEPRMLAAFAEFGQFLKRYGSRPRTITRRF